VAIIRSKHPGVRVTVKRMSTARIVALSIAPGVGGIAACLARGTPKQAEKLAADNISEHQAFERSESVNGVRQRIVILTTAQK